MRLQPRIKTKDMAVAAIFLAMILLFVFVPINILGIEVAFIPLIAVFIATQVCGFGMGIFAGASFGLASFAKAFLQPTPFSPIFYNPLVSIVPRLIVPITAYFVFILFKKILHKIPAKASTPIASMISSIVGIITNTGLVVGMMAAFNFGKVYGGTEIGKAFILSLIGVNFLIELGSCAVITPIIVSGLRIALGYETNDVKPNEEEKDSATQIDNEENQK